MAKKLMRGSDGLYHKNGKKFEMNIGSRAQVMHGTAYKTSGELLKKDLIYNKRKAIVSRKKHIKATREKRLEKAGYFTKKGKFGYVKKNKTQKKKGKNKK